MKVYTFNLKYLVDSEKSRTFASEIRGWMVLPQPLNAIVI